MISFYVCLMSMLEVGNIVKDYAHIMVGSQEVELGTGWDYSKVLSPFAESSPDKFTFAQHIVEMYEKTYSNITNDYTQSAVYLDEISLLETNVNVMAQLLTDCLK